MKLSDKTKHIGEIDSLTEYLKSVGDSGKSGIRFIPDLDSLKGYNHQKEVNSIVHNVLNDDDAVTDLVIFYPLRKHPVPQMVIDRIEKIHSELDKYDIQLKIHIIDLEPKMFRMLFTEALKKKR